MKKTYYYLFFVCFLWAHNACYSWKINTYSDDKNILEMKFKKFLKERPEFKFTEAHEWLEQFKRWYTQTTSSYCKLKPVAKKFACATVLNSPEMEQLVTDREYLKSDHCTKQEVEFLHIENLHNPEKNQAIAGFQCPPTRLVNEPFFLTDGEDLSDQNEGPTLYLLHRKDGQRKVNVVAHIKDVPEETLKTMQETKEKTNEDIIILHDK